MQFLRDFLSRSLERKFVFFMVAMVAIALVSISSVTTSGIRRIVAEDFQTRVSTRLGAAAAALGDHPDRAAFERARRVLVPFLADPDMVCVLHVSDKLGEPPVSLAGALPGGVAVTPQALLAPGPVLLYPRGGGENFVGWAMRQRHGSVFVVFSKAHTEDVLRDISTRFLEVAALVSILSCLLGLFMARLILRPIESFISAMRLIAEGQEIGRLVSLDQNELGAWTSTFNSMIEQLRRKHNLEMFVLNREKNEFVQHVAAGLAHRIRTPLTAINSLTQLVKGGGDGKKLKEWTGVILQKVRELDDAVGQFLTYAQPVPMQHQQAKLSESLGFAVDLLDRDLKQRKVTLERNLELEGERPQLHDPQQLQQALNQLLQSALSRSSEGGRLRISMTYREGEQGAVITIQDWGEPIPADMRASLFEPFGDTTNRYAGIGLSVAARLIELHGGDVFHQAPPEGGNCFVVTLPRLTAEQLALRSAKASRP